MFFLVFFRGFLRLSGGVDRGNPTGKDFGGLLGLFEGRLGKSFPCKNKKKHVKNIKKSRETKGKLHFLCFFFSFLCLHPCSQRLFPGKISKMGPGCFTLTVQNAQKPKKALKILDVPTCFVYLPICCICFLPHKSM